jgi:nitrate/TMAO reductase-like tetraheme cytochrome c subunit
MPHPQGWLGTAEEWTQGLGLALAVLELVLIVWVGRQLRRNGLTPALKPWLAATFLVVPLGVVYLAYGHGIEGSKRVESCGSCHVMKPYLADLRDPASEGLAATHYKNRYIQTDQCYTCHTDYGMFGTFKAKFEGLGHVVRNTTGAYTLPLKIAHPYPNARCLACHGESQKYLKSEGHPQDDLGKFSSGATSCLECHGPAHIPKANAS